MQDALVQPCSSGIMAHDTLTTSRLILRPACVDDAPAVFRHYAADAEVTRYLQWRPQPDVDAVRGFLRKCETESAAGREYSWVLAESTTGPALGMISLTLQSTFKAELGWVLARHYWGRGYMPEAVQIVTALALGALGCYRVSAYTDYENAQSARVMEKAGMQFEGRLRRYAVHPNLDSEPRDALLYAAWR